jgi:hypothetical protein
VTGRVPHLRIVVAACLIAVAGYASFSVWAVFYSQDATLVGDVIGTWKSFAVAAFTFWLGSSSGGKASPDDPGKPRGTIHPHDPDRTLEGEAR